MFHRLSESDNAPSTSGSRPSFALGRSLLGRPSVNTQPPPGRLSSLRSRDLTLGGFKKKTFAPNIHSVRKTKDELKEASHTAPKKEKRDKEERQKDGRGRKRDRPQTIQSHSIFEQGPADTIRRIGSWDSTDKNDCGPPQVLKCIKKEKHAFEDDTQDILQKLKRDDFLDDPGLKNDAKNRPIQLPLFQSSNVFNADEATTNMKEEPLCDDTTGIKVPRPQLKKAFLIPNQPTVAELFQKMSVSSEDELLFIQLPDTIPGQPSAHSDKLAKKEPKAEDKQTPSKSQDTPIKESSATLSDFTEGPIGKLQIRKSGKVQLVMGDVTLDVSEGAAFSFLQQLVSVGLSEGRTGDMTLLGNVKHKLVCSPDFETLLKEVVFAP
ncbi:UNVERIFIED_CONTAM: hypothetical protein FKN15_024846 [Acipenser sinensis]